MKPYYRDALTEIWLGDCREVMPSLPDCRLVFTSPPYNCGKEYAEHADTMETDGYFALVEGAVHAAAGILEPGGYLGLNVPSWIGSRQDRVYAFDEYKALCDRHLHFSDLIVWAKSPPNGAAWGNYPTSPRIRANHEWVLVYRAGGKPIGHNTIEWAEWSRLTQSVWPIQPTLPYRNEHPATFPSELPRRAIALFGTDEGIVLDPFMGMGTTLDVARAAGRRSIGIDVCEAYCEAVAERLSREGKVVA